MHASRKSSKGTLNWQITVREDGERLFNGCLPTLIQWEGRHPTDAMPDSGVVLQSLALNGVPDRARDVMRLRGVAVSSQAGPALQARFDTPLGAVTLQST